MLDSGQVPAKHFRVPNSNVHFRMVSLRLKWDRHLSSECSDISLSETEVALRAPLLAGDWTMDRCHMKGQGTNMGSTDLSMCHPEKPRSLLRIQDDGWPLSGSLFLLPALPIFFLTQKS